jgi:hypothetical protein
VLLALRPLRGCVAPIFQNYGQPKYRAMNFALLTSQSVNLTNDLAPEVCLQNSMQFAAHSLDGGESAERKLEVLADQQER